MYEKMEKSNETNKQVLIAMECDIFGRLLANQLDNKYIWHSVYHIHYQLL